MDDQLAKVAPLLEIGWRLAAYADEEPAQGLRRHERGRALGADSFLEQLKIALQRPLKPRKAGRKRLDKR